MNADEQFKTAIKRYQQNPSDSSYVSDFSHYYWGTLLDELCEVVRERKDVSKFLSGKENLINFGICPEILPDPDSVKKNIIDGSFTDGRLQIQTVVSWLTDLSIKIIAGDRKEQIERDINVAQIQIRKLENEVEILQQERKDAFVQQLLQGGQSSTPSTRKRIEDLESTDLLLRESIRGKKSIARGVFFSVEQKREHAARESQLLKEVDRVESLTSLITDHQVTVDIKKRSSLIQINLTKIIDLEDNVAKMSAEVSEIQRRQNEISPLEVESRIRKEIEYVRDLVRLSAKRMHRETCPLLRNEDKYFTVKTLAECLDRMIEFDPAIFHNDRVGLFGRPSVLLVPGTGNALYDWKNNRLICPIVVPGGNFMASISEATIEYRLDVDEEKRLLNSYNQIPEMKNIRSIFQIKSRLTKDYVVWMTSEYKGYRILAKNFKDWFEHQIGPSKTEIFTPLEYQQFNLSASQCRDILQAIETKLARGITVCTDDNLWAGSILYCQQGNFEQSMKLLAELLKRNPTNLMALYNCGQIAMKNMNKQLAVQCFTEFCNLNPQSWWARIASDHLRRLKMG